MIEISQLDLTTIEEFSQDQSIEKEVEVVSFGGSPKRSYQSSDDMEFDAPAVNDFVPIKESLKKPKEKTLVV